MFQIKTISSLNLRTRRGKPIRSLSEPFRYYCSLCTRRRTLGVNDSVLIKVDYCLDDQCKEVKICERCIDVLSDCLRFGPKVLEQIHRWERKSRVVRVSFVEGERECYTCPNSNSTHMYIKFDDLARGGSCEHYDWSRVCARCVMSYMEMMIESNDLNTAKVPFIEVKMFENARI